MGVSGQFHAPAVLNPGNDLPGTYWIGGSVGSRDALDAVVKSYWKDLGQCVASYCIRRLTNAAANQLTFQRQMHEHTIICHSCMKWNPSYATDL
jgi:hypothetical protein